MRKFAYTVIVEDQKNGELRLNELGQQGWRVISCVRYGGSCGGNYCWTLERELSHVDPTGRL